MRTSTVITMRTAVAKSSVGTLLVAALPWRGYERTFASLRVSKYPLRAVGNCIRALQAVDPIGTPGIYNAWTTMNSHSYFYYWRDLAGKTPTTGELSRCNGGW